MSAARAAARNKPVIVVKAGRARQRHAGRRLAHRGAGRLGHRVRRGDPARRHVARGHAAGALHGRARRWRASARNRDEKLSVMTNGGGAGVMAADAAAARRRHAGRLGGDAARKLDAVLPPTWSHANPIDIIGDAPVARYTETLQALLADPATAARCSSCMRRPRSCAATTSRAPARRSCARRGPRHGVLAGRRGGRRTRGASSRSRRGRLRDAGGGRACLRHARNLPAQPGACCWKCRPRAKTGRRIWLRRARWHRGALADGRDMLDEARSEGGAEGLRHPGRATVAWRRIGRGCCAAAREIGYPVALKILSPDISHKSDVGGVRLNLRDEGELRRRPASDAGARAQRAGRRRGSTASPCRRWCAAAGAGTDRGRERRPGVRPGAAVRTGRHGGRGVGRSRRSRCRR